jgi:hypothetical protein
MASFSLIFDSLRMSTFSGEAHCYAQVNGMTVNTGYLDLYTCASTIHAGSPSSGTWGDYSIDVDSDGGIYVDSQYAGALDRRDQSLTTRCQNGDVGACSQYNRNVDSILERCRNGERILGVCN